jgi:hypothetical protein
MKIIEKQGSSKLVEYREGRSTKRVILPITEDDISLGVQYGIPFSLLLQQSGMAKIDADRTEQKLHNAGIWTEDDLRKHPGVIEALNINLGELLHLNTPDLSQLDWSGIQQSLSSLLESKEIYTVEDIQQRNQDFIWCIKMSLAKPLMNLYRRNENVNS